MCFIAVSEIKVPGHIVSRDGVRTDPTKLEIIAHARIPKSKKELCSSLMFCSLYKRFVKRSVKILASLHEQAADRVQYVWNPEPDEAFALLSKCRSGPSILAFPDNEKPFVVFVDAFWVATMASLMTKQPSGKLHRVTVCE